MDTSPLTAQPRGVCCPCAYSVLEVWACAVDIYLRAQTKIQAEGLLTLAPNTGVPMVNPYLSIADKQALMMTEAAVEMGFTPASRSNVSAATRAEDVVDA